MNNASLLDGRYSLPSEPANSGAHAKLYKAFDVQDHVPVAVKAFLREQIHDERVLTRAWQNELEVYSKLDSNVNLARFLDFGKQPGGEPYLVFEWLRGDLWAYLKERPVEGWDDFWPIAKDILRGLAGIHEAGYVHRDLKPENILHSDDGIQKVADFGTTRLIESVSVGLTMAPLGTQPYCPPEISTQNPTFAYDIYSFAVLVVCCLADKMPGSHIDVLDLLADTDLPYDISDVLTTCLSENPESRPGSAGVLLAQLTEIQAGKDERRRVKREVHLELSDQRITVLAEVLGCSKTQARDRVTEELTGSVYGHFNDRSENPAFELVTDTLLFRLQPHQTRRFLRILSARQHSPELNDKARSQWLRLNAHFRFTAPLDHDRSIANLDELIDEIREHDARQTSVTRSENSEFRIWKQVLQAKFDEVRSQGNNIAFRSWRKEGNRIYFDTTEASLAESGESRLVRVGQRPIIFGEIEKTSGSEIVFYVERGSTDRLPRSGILEFDSQASLGKLKREQAALDRLQGNKSLRPDLKQLLLEPAKNREPSRVSVPHFIHDSLDIAKRTAVQTALGNQDFLLVQGPPGTGKTTFIAELVGQVLAENPKARILLASQTHVALDNALVRISNLCPTAAIVRVGREDKLSGGATDFGLATVLGRWTERVQALATDFIRTYAANLGIDLDGPSVELDVADFSTKLDKRANLRSKVALRQAERGDLTKKVDNQRLLGERLLAAALRLENFSSAVAMPELLAAATDYVDVGLRVAERLELDQVVTGRLSEIEASLTNWRDDIRTMDGS